MIHGTQRRAPRGGAIKDLTPVYQIYAFDRLVALTDQFSHVSESSEPFLLSLCHPPTEQHALLQHATPDSPPMNIPRAISLVEATASVIERGLSDGRWRHLPGERRLAAELEVGRSTLRQALHLLTSQGRLAAPTQGRRREVSTHVPEIAASRALRIGLLTGLPPLSYMPSTQRFLLELRHALEDSKYQLLMGLPDLSSQCRRKGGLAAIAEENPADLWMIVSGTWEQLEYFSMRPEPALAIGGRSVGLDIASVGFDISLGLRSAVRKLIALGHRRIVLLCESLFRNAPEPGRVLIAFHEEMRAANIQPSGFHLPDWNDSPADLQRALGELFRFTPPTAIIANTPNAAFGLLGFCNERRLRIPEDVSLVFNCGQDDDAWFHPRPSVISNTGSQLIPSILRWISTCSNGKPSRRQILLSTEFRDGKSIGPPKQG